VRDLFATHRTGIFGFYPICDTMGVEIMSFTAGKVSYKIIWGVIFHTNTARRHSSINFRIESLLDKALSNDFSNSFTSFFRICLFSLCDIFFELITGAREAKYQKNKETCWSKCVKNKYNVVGEV
jgi:hypothetical protein